MGLLELDPSVGVSIGCLVGPEVAIAGASLVADRVKGRILDWTRNDVSRSLAPLLALLVLPDEVSSCVKSRLPSSLHGVGGSRQN